MMSKTFYLKVFEGQGHLEVSESLLLLVLPVSGQQRGDLRWHQLTAEDDGREGDLVAVLGAFFLSQVLWGEQLVDLKVASSRWHNGDVVDAEELVAKSAWWQSLPRGLLQIYTRGGGTNGEGMGLDHAEHRPAILR